MGNIYATPESDVTQPVHSVRAGGNIEDAIEGNIDAGMFAILYFKLFGAESQTLAD